MAVVAAWLYRDGGRVRAVEIGEAVACGGGAEFVWIGMADPTAAEMAVLQRSYGLHPLAVEDALHADQLPKVDVYGDRLFVTAMTAQLAGGAIAYGQTAFFLGPGHIITVRSGSDRGYGTLRGHLEAAPALLRHGADYVLHSVLDYIVDGYLPMVETIEGEVQAMEQRTIDAFLGRQEITRIFSLRRELVGFHRALLPMSEVAGKLARADLPCIDVEIRVYFSDVLDHVSRARGMVDDLREALNSVFEFSNLLEQQRTGAITRQLAAWAAILAVPTAIAGIYGMNFADMPELKWKYGYPTVWAVIVVSCVGLYIRFKQVKWL